MSALVNTFDSSAPRIHSLYYYPLKSARGIECNELRTDALGVAGDRRWLLIDPSGVFVSQRSLAKMAMLEARPSEDGLHLSYGDAEITQAVPEASAVPIEVEVWGDSISALHCDTAVNDWLSQQLDASIRLVYYPYTSRRPVDPAYASNNESVSFADGFPLLIIGQSSLDDLNSRLPEPVSMDRFRPNIVIEGSPAFAEDEWKTLLIGGVELSLVKPCSRCVIPSIVQSNGERDPYINRTLAGYRRREGKIYFGMNALVPANATFRVGDGVQITA